MDLFRSRFAAAVASLAVAIAFPACGDDDGKGAAEEIDKGADDAGNKIEKEGRELEDDVEGREREKEK